MKTVDEFLSELRRKNVKLWSEGKNLRYRANKETLTPELLQELRERKAEILMFLHQADAASSSNFLPILPAPRDGNLPLSFAQTRLWFLDQLEPGSSTYNMSFSYRLTGSLNIAALEQSFNEIIQRHEVLRTTFPAVNGQPSQVIATHKALSLPIRELRDYPETEREAHAQQIATTEAQKPFNLATDPLFRVQLLRLEEAEYVLLLNMHHIISDGWSFNVFFQELTALYTAFSTNKPSPLPELPIQYADFAIWQHEGLRGEVLESQLNYWKQQLSGNLPILQLPTDYPRPTLQTYRGASQSLELPNNLTEKLKSLSQREGVTLFMTLLAAFQTLLYRYSGHEDLIIGTPIAGRNQVETEKLIGFFVNALALRTNFSGQSSFLELLSQVRKVALGAYSHQKLPFEKLVEELQPERDPSRSPLFQVMFVLQNASISTLELPCLTINSLKIDRTTAKFDLTLFIKESTQGFVASLEYNTDLFAATTITRMLGHFQTLLEGIVANPEQCLSNFPLLTAAEQHQLLVEWNHTTTNYPNNTCIHQLFEEQVERTPDAVALVYQERQMTYQELNSRANQLGQHLRSKSVGSEVLVGICVERSIEAIVGILAILKAGGAYVPLDPDYPQERLAFMLEDTGVSLLLTQKQLREKLPVTSAQILELDAFETCENCIPNLSNSVTANNLAYVMYTSGSTGQPKGVSVIHRGVVRLVKGNTYANLSGEDVFLQLAPISFDASTFEIWGSLLNGAKLAIFPVGIPDLEELGQEIRRHCVTTLWLTAGLFHLMVDEQLEDLKSLRQLLAGGDILSVSHVRKFLQTVPGCQLINGYGPTENTTFTCCYSMSNVTKLENSVPIGRSIANTQVYILDGQMQPVPTGVPGELYTSGDGLARGYWHRPELTAEKFISHPFSSQPDARLYKTGDLACYLPDGNIEFLGRIDNQVKIRGFRIELGEIETVLGQHPHVEEAVVIAIEDNPGDKRLVAYIVSHPNSFLSPEELRGFLKQQLPNYMIPAAFVPLEALPLTPNGKIDRSHLPAPEWLRSTENDKFIAPKDELERQLVQIWEQVLGKKNIGVGDNFFDLGGHSLLAVQLFVQIEKLCGQKLPLSQLFQSPTIQELAPLLRQSGWQPSWSSLVPIQPQGFHPPFFCVHPIGGEVFRYRLLSDYLGADQPFYGLRAQGLDGKLPPHTCLEEMAAHYLQEILQVQPQGPYFIGGASSGGRVAFEMARQLVEGGRSVALLALFDCGLPDEWMFKITTFQAQEPSSDYTKKVVDASRFALNSYVPKVYPGRIALFQCDWKVWESQSSLQIVEQRNQRYVFSEWVLCGCELHEVPGEHMSIFDEPNVQVLSDKFKSCLNRARIDSPELREKETISLYQKAIALNPVQPFWVYQHLADLLRDCGELQASLVFYQKALELQPFWVYRQLGEALSNYDLLEEALTVYERRLHLDGDRGNEDTNLAKTWEDIEPRIEVIEDYLKFLQLQPIWLYHNLKPLLQKKDKNDASWTVYKKAIECLPQCPEIYYKFGTYQLRHGQVDAALSSYQKAIELKPNYSDVYCCMGDAYLQKGDTDRALDSYELATQFNSLSFQAFLKKGNVFRQIRQSDRAIESYKNAAKIRPEHPAVYCSLGRCYLESGDLENAEKCFNKSIKLSPSYAQGYQGLGDLFKQGERLEDAIIQYQKSIHLNPNIFGVYKNLADILCQQGKIDAAITNYQRAAEIQPNNINIYRILGNAQWKNGDRDGAILSYQKSVELNPEQPFGVYKKLGDGLSQKGQFPEAIVAYTEALKLQPNSEAVRLNLDRISASIVKP